MTDSPLVVHSEEYKIAYLWVATLHGSHFGSDLYFSSLAKVYEIVTELNPGDIVMAVKVPKDFDHWDFMPDNY